MSYEETRQRHLEYLMGLVPEHLARLTWSAERLRAERTARLRHVVRHAATHSPWHRQRLASVDVESLDEDGLRRLPTMTKADLMAHFDAIVTDPRVTLELVNAHIAGLTADAYLLEEYHAVASGGSSGSRGVFVWDWAAWAECFLSGMRRTLHDTMNDPAPDPAPLSMMMVAADRASHVTSSIGQTFANPAVPIVRCPVTWPLERIVEQLNRADGNVLLAYASMLVVLANEARAGRLTIAPRRVVATAEPLLPEIRALVQEVWGVHVANQWGTSEAGIMALGCYRDAGMHLSDDLIIVEAVDRNGDPVPAGVESAKVYLTNLFNPLMPLIRYEITDQITVLDEPCACGSAFRRIADIQGRLDDVFTYRGSVVVHPHVFRSVLGREARISEYQVRQTADGAEVLVRASEALPLEPLLRALEQELGRAGCRPATVSGRVVDEIPRIGIGKLKRFVPLSSAQ
jgi:phenylacetate-CoA ligase